MSFGDLMVRAGKRMFRFSAQWLRRGGTRGQPKRVSLLPRAESMRPDFLLS